MDSAKIATKFEEIGARLRFSKPNRFRRPENNLAIDIKEDSEGEFFDIILGDDAPELSVLDTKKGDRHLLLMAKDDVRKQKFLCGFDERHFFSCAIPESAGVSTVLQAKQALKPASIVKAEQGVKKKNLHKRKKKAPIGKIYRQGEFFFTPMPDYSPGKDAVIHKKEPMQRNRMGKPHMAEYLIRFGGETVHICSRHPDGVSKNEYEKIITENTNAKSWDWSQRVKNPEVYAMGKISHADHKTLNLKHIWHRVTLNTEDKAWASRNVAFID